MVVTDLDQFERMGTVCNSRVCFMQFLILVVLFICALVGSPKRTTICPLEDHYSGQL